MSDLASAAKSLLRESIGTPQLVMAINQLSDKVDRISNKQSQNQVEVMAKLAEVFAAIEATGVALAEKVNVESAEIMQALQAAKASVDGATSSQLDEIIAKVGMLGSTVGDSIVALVPSMDTPAAVTPAPDPVVLPTPDPVEVPNIEIPVDITPADLGVAGASSIEAQ